MLEMKNKMVEFSLGKMGIRNRIKRSENQELLNLILEISWTWMDPSYAVASFFIVDCFCMIFLVE